MPQLFWLLAAVRVASLPLTVDGSRKDLMVTAVIMELGYVVDLRPAGCVETGVEGQLRCRPVDETVSHRCTERGAVASVRSRVVCVRRRFLSFLRLVLPIVDGIACVLTALIRGCCNTPFRTKTFHCHAFPRCAQQFFY